VTDARCTRRITVSVDNPRAADGIRANGNYAKTTRSLRVRSATRIDRSGKNEGPRSHLKKDWTGSQGHSQDGHAAGNQDQGTEMKSATPRPYADSEAAARKLIEIANSVEAVQDGRIYIELINGPMLFDH
jgi:hypothetical protein